MKCYAWILYLCLGVAPVLAGEAARIVERGPHHRAWQRDEVLQLPNGTTINRPHGYVELATGMHYWENGQWHESRELVEPLATGGAVARYGQHQVIFGANLNTLGAIEITTADGRRLRSHVLGLAFTDAATGQSVMVATIKDSVGEIIGANEVLYRDAFTSVAGVRIDARYRYTRAGLEQDVIIRSGGNLLRPRDFGLADATSRLQIFSEFVEAPAPVRQSTALKPGFIDDRLDFGAMLIGSGVAFAVGANADAAEVPVGKTWEQRDGRTFLIESVDYTDIAPQLVAVRQASIPAKNEMAAFAKPVPSSALAASLSQPPGPSLKSEPMQMAKLSTPEEGFVIDWSAVASATNFTFRGDSTYIVMGQFNVRDTIFEGGTVIKYTNSTGSARISLQGTTEFRTTPYRPAYFTAQDDNTVGETIDYSTGNPSGTYANTALRPDNTALTCNISNVVIRYATRGVAPSANSPFTVLNGQFLNCGYGIETSVAATTRNCLFNHCTGAFNLTAAQNNIGEHLTISECLRVNLNFGNSLFLTNCLVVANTNYDSFAASSSHVQTNTVFSDVFQTVGAARHYLLNDAYRGAGDANVSPITRAELNRRTTYPPLLLTNQSKLDLTLTPQAARDTNSLPTLGYHYAPLDYLVSGLIVTNSTITMREGVAVGVDYSTGSWGFIFKAGKLVSEGTPLVPNYIVRTHMVQEGSSPNPTTRAIFYDGLANARDSEVRLRFTELVQRYEDGYILYTGEKFAAVEFAHSAAYNATFIFNTASSPTGAFGFTNTLWHGGFFVPYGSSSNASLDLWNNLFRYLLFELANGTTTSARVRDNLFERTSITDDGSTVSNSHNAFFETTGTGFGGAISNTNLVTLTYETGPLGYHYLPTTSPLINLGSRNATNAGLYHFTTTTDQVKETTNQVDIGLHYVALTNSLTAAVDTDGDTLADYLEDRNGNGSAETNAAPFESDWKDDDTDNDTLRDDWEILYGFNPLINEQNDDPDGDANANSFEYFYHNDPRDNWVWAWGVNNYRPSTNQTPGLGVSAISAGLGHTLAVNDDGRILVRGNNSHGQTNTPAGLSNVVAVAAGDTHSLALKSDGSVVAWGRNDSGETDVPANVTNVIAISAAGHQSLALKGDGSVVQWGETFTTAPSLTTATAIASGTNFHLALLTNKTVVAWGANTVVTNVPAGLNNIVAIATGGAHALGLRENGTVIAWGMNGSGQTNVPSNLTNIMSVAAGYAHSLVLSNNGTVFAWGDNSSGQTTVPTITDVKLIAGGGNQSLAAIWSPLIEYPVDVSRDLLLIYNTNSIDSSNVCVYYLAHRPMVSRANVLGIDCPTNEIVTPTQFTNQIAAPVLNWLNTNPSKRPTYVILFLDVPSRVNTNIDYNGFTGWETNPTPSVSFRIYSLTNNWRPLVTSINMNGTNDCRGYIDKLQSFGTAYSPGRLEIRPNAAGYGNTNFVVDGVRYGAGVPMEADRTQEGIYVSNAVTGLLQSGIPSSSILQLDGIEPGGVTLGHLTNASNVSGYISWGSHSTLGGGYATNQFLQWTGQSGWWIIETAESLNGIRGSGQGNLTRWFSPNAWGSSGYSNAPIAGVTHVEEPTLPRINDASVYFVTWLRGKRFATAAWRSRLTEYFQAVGDPFIKR